MPQHRPLLKITSRPLAICREKKGGGIHGVESRRERIYTCSKTEVQALAFHDILGTSLYGASP